MKAMFLSGLLGWMLLSAPRGSFGAELADASVPTAIIGIDHIPLVVGNLDWAAARYRQLGFALKPGRAHDNGLRNSHVKFSGWLGHRTDFATACSGRRSGAALRRTAGSG